MKRDFFVGFIILCRQCRLPFYYELKIAIVVWLLSPYTKGSSVLYRKFVHPTLSSKEKVKTLPLLDLPFTSTYAVQGKAYVGSMCGFVPNTI